MSRLSAVVLVLALALGTEACDRCGGILGCTGNPRLSMEGQLIARESGRAVSGAAIDFVRTGGVALTRDSVRTVTDADGRFQLAVEASDVGDVVGDLVVRAPDPWSPYRVRGLRFRTSVIRGEGQVLGRLLVDLYVEFIAVLIDRRTGQPLVGAHVTIRRTGGVVTSPDTYEADTDDLGRIFYNASAADVGAMLADVTVSGGPLPRAYHLSGVPIATQYLDSLPHVAAIWRIGSGLPYVGVLYRRGSGVRSAGIEVEFQRTGGIDADPDRFVVATDADGAFGLSPTPLADGVLIGRLIVRPPPPAVAETIQAVRLQTVDTEPLILLGVWGYGYQVFYGSQLWLRGTERPATAGLPVTFRRTGGIAITPDSIVVQTDATGMFPLVATADGAGEVVGDLTVRLPAPFPPTVITGVRIPTFASDSMRFLGLWGVGPSLRYLGQVLRSDTDAPIADAVVEFQRTSGIAVAPSLLTSRTIASGLFPLAPNPLDTGEVVGDLTIHPPAPFRDTTFIGIRLRTFDSDTLRLGGVWRLAPPQ